MKKTNNKKSLAKNYIYMTLFQLLTVLSPLITSPYLARTLGANANGIYSYTNSIFNWVLLIATLGINVYGAKEIAKYEDEEKKLSKTFSEIFLMQILFNAFVAILYYIILFIVRPNFLNIYCIYGIYLFANIINVSWLYTGIEDFKKIAIRGCIIKVFFILFTFIFVHTPEDLLKYVVIVSLSSLISNLYMLIGLNKIAKPNFKEVRFKSILKHFKANFILFIPQIAISIYALLDQPMIGWLGKSYEEVGFYQKGEQIVKMTLYIITSIGTIMMPRIANLFYKKDHEKVKEYLNNVIKIVFYLAFPLMFGIIAVSPFFVNWFFTESFSRVSIIMISLSPIIVFISLSNVIGIQYLLPTDKTKEYTTSVIVGAIVNLIFNLILIPRYKAVGAAIATVIAEASVFIYQYIAIRKENLFENNLKLIITTFVNALVMGIAVYFIGRTMGISPVTTIIQIIVGVLIYLIMSKISNIEIQEKIIDTVLEKLKMRKKNEEN